MGTRMPFTHASPWPIRLDDVVLSFSLGRAGISYSLAAVVDLLTWWCWKAWRVWWGSWSWPEAKHGGVKIGGTVGRRSRALEPQVMGKVLADHLVLPKTLERAPRKIWCPIKAVTCNDLGCENFLDFATIALSFFWQILSNYRITRIKRFVSRFTSKLCN